MSLGRKIAPSVAAGVLMWAAASAAVAQGSVTLNEPPVRLLPQSFAGWQQSAAEAGEPQGSISLTTVSKQALVECGPLRSQVTEYTHNGRTLRVEAIEFGDRTGAYSAFTLVEKPDMKPVRDLGSSGAAGEGAVLLTQGDAVVLASPADNADLPALRELAKVLPKVNGPRGVAPLLPSLVPGEHLVPGSIRYALGPATYAAEGGVLPANSLGWSKSAEGVTAGFDMKHGHETLTLLLYPTPQIAQAFTRALTEGVKGMGPSFANAQVRHENELVMVASGTLPAKDAQAMLADVHLKQEVAVDRYMAPVFHAEVQKTFSLLQNIAILSGVMMTAAVLLGLFLGGARAAIRVMQGKSAAAEPEFLSLHLAPQNAAPRFDSAGQGS